jgi:hypothetical protein
MQRFKKSKAAQAFLAIQAARNLGHPVTYGPLLATPCDVHGKFVYRPNWRAQAEVAIQCISAGLGTPARDIARLMLAKSCEAGYRLP